MTTRIVTLSDAPPVRIVEAEWPQIAIAFVPKSTISVRRHEDGRSLVYAVRHANGVRHAAGQMLAPTEDVVLAIHEVGGESGIAHDLIRQAIQSLPPTDAHPYPNWDPSEGAA